MNDRRAFLQKAGLTLCGAAGTLISGAATAEEHSPPAPDSPAEQIMHQHGLIQRLVLTYDEIARRLKQGKAVPGGALNTGAFVTRFIEGYHEKLEEKHLFPLFQKKNEYRPLIKTLGKQHKAGQKLAERVYFLAGRGNVSKDPVRSDLADALHKYGRMYRAHAAYEDTVLLPALRKVADDALIQKISSQFEQMTQDRLGEEGLRGVLQQLRPIEKELGIGGLNSYTPSISD